MKISLINGVYDVYEFDASHNHILAPGTMTHFLRSQRKVTEAQIANAEVAKSVGISNKAIINMMAKQVGGIENLWFRFQLPCRESGRRIVTKHTRIMDRRKYVLKHGISILIYTTSDLCYSSLI
jgi:hypothetical protein